MNYNTKSSKQYHYCQANAKMTMIVPNTWHKVLLVVAVLTSMAGVAVVAFQPSPRPAVATTSTTTTTTSSLTRRIGMDRLPRSRHTTTSTALLASSSSSSLTLLNSAPSNRWVKDVVIVGGGLAGLSIALHLSQLDPERHICILDNRSQSESPTGSFAAAGMLAPHSERLPKGHYLDLCLESKSLFPDFAAQVERLARESGPEGAEFLVPEDPASSSSSSSSLEPWNIGYVAAGGFLAPAFAGDNVATWAPPCSTNPDGSPNDNKAVWLDATQVKELEPQLSRNVVGGWWFPEDASVDARRLTASLKAACVGAGVQFLTGPSYEVTSLDLEQGNCRGLWLKNGKYVQAKDIVVANGSWMRNLLPVPLEPHKGQSLSLRMPKDQPPLLRRVLFAQDSYIVPKADGRIVIGATVEAGSYDGKVTPAGIMHILSYALELLPGLKDLPLEETWAGLRPTTPDKGPILGETPWNNLFLAGGYWRNGVLLAPKTGELMAKLISKKHELTEQDQIYLKAFSWDRFTSKEGGIALAANARYAAAMYPVHQRKSGVGVAASVGTELGSYSTAVSAREERQKDRESLWGNDDSFEQAAIMGQQDGSVFSFGDDGERTKWGVAKGNEKNSQNSSSDKLQDEEDIKNNPTDPSNVKKEDLPHFFDLNPEFIEDEEHSEETKQPSETSSSSTLNDDLNSIYQKIQENKTKQQVEMGDKNEKDDRPDPGFRIYHVDSKTGAQTEVPPYTSPGDFLESLKQKKGLSTATQNQSSQVQASTFSPAPTANSAAADQNEQTYDGYQDIIQAASKDTNIRETMRQARMKNRDESENMSYTARVKESPYLPNSSENEDLTSGGSSNGLSSVYDKIRQQQSSRNMEMGEASQDDRPDPGFRIHHVDSETGERREVPPYTSPGDFLESIKPKKQPDEETSQKVVEMDHDGPPKTSSLPRLNGTTKTLSSESQQLPAEYSEQTYDGYQDIIGPNSSKSRNEQMDSMREARRRNRLGDSGVDESKI